MSFDTQLTHTITTYRLRGGGIGQGIKRTFQENLVGQPCLIQPVTAQFAATTGMVYGKTYNLFLPLDTDINISDKLVDQNGKLYEISGILTRNYGRNGHLTAYITEPEGAAVPGIPG